MAGRIVAVASLLAVGLVVAAPASAAPVVIEVVGSSCVDGPAVLLPTVSDDPRFTYDGDPDAPTEIIPIGLGGRRQRVTTTGAVHEPAGFDGGWVQDLTGTIVRAPDGSRTVIAGRGRVQGVGFGAFAGLTYRGTFEIVDEPDLCPADYTRTATAVYTIRLQASPIQ